MPLDPQVQEYLRKAAEDAAPPINALSPAEARRQMEAKTLLMGDPPPIGRTDDRTIDTPHGPIKARVYTPLPEAIGAKPMPVLVYFHGGGWVIGSVETHDGLCRAIANEAGSIVVSVDYRLAPEYPFPAAVEDAYESVRWTHQHAAELGGDPTRLGVAGDSAGGNLATVTALLSRERGGPPIAWQLLIYPATDSDLDSATYLEFAEGFGLNRAEMAWFMDHYVETPEERINPLASPIRADSLSGLPPAFIMTAEYDVLRDEGERYADRLSKAGVPVTLKRYDGMNHGFLRRFMFFDKGRTALQDIGREMRKALNG